MAATEAVTDLALFPLRTVLFPGGNLPLKIFEQRYLDLVRDCVRDEVGFGVCMLVPADDGPAGIAKVGTLALIDDWYLREDGLLGINAQGGKRFRMQKTWARDNGLLCARVEWLDDEQQPVPPECSVLVTLLRQIIEQTGIHLPDMTEASMDNAAFVSNRLAELLPLELEERQQLLETDDPSERLRKLFIQLRVLQERQQAEDEVEKDEEC